MARADLSAMLGKLDETPVTKQASDHAVPAATPAAPPERIPTTVQSDATQRGYKAFERKETRLRADQYSDLTEEARRLNRAKRTGTPRITENTLVRVAIDLLLERRDDLAGNTEEELRKSVGL